ncbi:hypothetical protein Q3G72_014454 [Acer saccharum]|nr:hypothetical protein Q3G72_014454 [Acer saccharum]
MKIFLKRKQKPKDYLNSRGYARKQIGMICLPRRELKRSRRQSWLCFGGGSDSAEWWGGGSDSQHAISIDDEENDSNQYSSSQPVLRVGHSEARSVSQKENTNTSAKNTLHQVAELQPSVGTNAKFPESSTPCLGLLKRKCSRSYARKQIGRIHLARRELKRSRRQSWLCFGGGSDSAEWSGGGGGAGRSDSQHAISIPDEQNDINQYPSSQPVLRVGHSESDDIQHSATSPGIEESSHIDIQDDNDIHGHHEAQPRRNDDKNQKENDTQHNEVAEEIKMRHVEIEKDTCESYQERQMISSTNALRSDDTQHSATSAGIAGFSHIDIQDDKDIYGHHEVRPWRNDDKNQKVDPSGSCFSWKASAM